MLYYSETENNKAFIYINIALIISMGYIPLCLILEEKKSKSSEPVVRGPAGTPVLLCRCMITIILVCPHSPISPVQSRLH